MKKILLTKDPRKVNHYVALSCIIDAFVWTVYSLVISDVYFLVLNVTALTAGSLQYTLCLWVTGYFADNSWIIR
mgnify:CR=1 FL=1